MEPRTADRILSTLNKYRCVSPYQPHTQYPFDLNQITPGIFCPKCGSYQIGIHNRCIVCQNCNCQEEKSSAVKRLIAECATLFPEQTFQKKDLMYLANHQVGRTTLHFYTRNLCRKLAQGLYQYENSHQLPQQLKLYRAHINDRWTSTAYLFNSIRQVEQTYTSCSAQPIKMNKGTLVVQLNPSRWTNAR